MGKRGPQSSSALSVPMAANIEAFERPDAPYDLTDAQSEEWRAVVNRLPADWFPRETWPMLAQYCRHVVAARHLAKLIHDMETEGIEIAEYDRLLKMQQREGHSLSSLATRMRLTQQSTYDREKAKPKSQAKKLWE